VFVVSCIVASAAAAADRSAPPGPAPKPTVLLLHGGGFIFDDPLQMPVASGIARELGFQPIFVDYPNFDLRGAVAAASDAARDAAQRGGSLYAYGDSAGGTLAALLAESNLVDAAATYSPVANMRRFAQSFENPDYYMALIGAERKLLLRASPGLHDSDRPILALAATGDEAYFRAAIGKWARRDPEIERRLVAGPHAGAPREDIYARNARLALRWLARQG
jgi:acetyl esterase/lipase